MVNLDFRLTIKYGLWFAVQAALKGWQFVARFVECFSLLEFVIWTTSVP